MLQPVIGKMIDLPPLLMVGESLTKLSKSISGTPDKYPENCFFVSLQLPKVTNSHFTLNVNKNLDFRPKFGFTPFL